MSTVFRLNLLPSASKRSSRFGPSRSSTIQSARPQRPKWWTRGMPFIFWTERKDVFVENIAGVSTATKAASTYGR